jgi:hypothetical protein
MTPNNASSDTGSRGDTSSAESTLSDAAGQADGIVPDRVQQLQWIHQARSARLSRTAADLKSRYGANDTGVKRAEAEVAASQAASARIAVAHQLMAMSVPDVPANGWALYGVVYDTAAKPVPRLTVFLVDASKTLQSAYGYTYTDESGRFVLAYQEPKDAGRETVASGKQDVPTLFVQVSDMKRRTVYSSDTPAQLAFSVATPLGIVIGAGDAVIGEPPAEAPKGPPPKGKSKG